MKDTPRIVNRNRPAVHWMARLSSLAVNSAYALILYLALTNEEEARIAAIPVLILLVVTILSGLAAWRWEWKGGLAVLLSSVCLGVAAYCSSRAHSLGPHFLAPLVYATPGLLVGALFLLAARAQKRSGRNIGRALEEV